MDIQTRNTLNKMAQIIFDKKGFNILALDVAEQSTLCDYMIIAEGNVNRHLQAIANTIIDDIKKEMGFSPYLVEGKGDGDWVVLDYQSIVIHLFLPSLREKYQIEKLWSEGKLVDLDIKVDNVKDLP